MVHVISVEGLTVFQDHHPVLKDVSFQIAKNDFVYLIGKTGSGKSSLLRILYADLPFTQGFVEVAGFKLNDIKKSNVPYLRRKIGIIFQDFQLLTDRTVAENLIFAMKATGWNSKQKMKQRLTEVLIQVGLGYAEHKYPYQLSGGEQQRVVIARSLINEPAVLIADEPTGNLDPEVAEEILKVFIDINHNGTAILMATHQHDFLKKYPARVLVCKGGILTENTSVYVKR